MAIEFWSVHALDFSDAGLVFSLMLNADLYASRRHLPAAISVTCDAVALRAEADIFL